MKRYAVAIFTDDNFTQIRGRFAAICKLNGSSSGRVLLDFIKHYNSQYDLVKKGKVGKDQLT